MTLFPKPWQIERKRNPHYLHSAWLGLYFVFFNAIAVLWSTWIRGTWHYLHALVWNTIAMVFMSGRLLLYGVLGGLQTNNKTIQQIAQENFEKFCKQTGVTPEPADEEAAGPDR